MSADVRRGGVPWWGLASSVGAPIVLVLGWTLAAELQPHNPERYDWIRQTVSVLAAPDAADRWVMSATFLLVGACDVVTGLALRPAARAGRVVLIVGAIAGMLVAANPEPGAGGSSARHAFFAGIGLVALTIWPVAAAHWREPEAHERRAPIPWGLRPVVATWAAGLTTWLFGWFCIELLAGLDQLGLAERALGEFQAVWPLIVVLSCRRRPVTPPSADSADEDSRRGYARSRASRTDS